MRYRFLLLFCFHALIGKANPEPVLLFLSKQDQPDTLGYNLVKEIPALVYKEVMSGRVPLWDSPEKTVQIRPSTLKRLEEAGADTFSSSRQLFIYEIWDLDKKKGVLNTVGFYFSNRNSRGEDVSYGFVDYVQLDSLFRKTTIPSNANGDCKTTFYEALNRHHYNYNIVQIGSRKIDNVIEALARKSEVRDLLAKHISPANVQCKKIQYSIDSTLSPLNRGSNKSALLLKAVQLYLNENREVFYNLGGDRIRNFIEPQKISVTGIEIWENWEQDSGTIKMNFLGMTIYAEGQPLDKIGYNDLGMLDLTVDFRSIYDFLNEKEFYFRILKINDQAIPSGKEDAYLKALRSWKWNDLSEYVKYE